MTVSCCYFKTTLSLSCFPLTTPTLLPSGTTLRMQTVTPSYPGKRKLMILQNQVSNSQSFTKKYTTKQPYCCMTEYHPQDRGKQYQRIWKSQATFLCITESNQVLMGRAFQRHRAQTKEVFVWTLDKLAQLWPLSQKELGSTFCRGAWMMITTKKLHADKDRLPLTAWDI